MKNPLITLWDASGKPSEYPGITYTWEGYSEENGARSLYRYIDTHAERLRGKYLSWIHELGQSQVKQKPLIDHLVIQDDLSYWWLTSLVEKSQWKSPRIKDAIRLFALEEIIIHNKPEKLRLVTANPSLHKALRDLCQNLNIAYEWKRSSIISKPALSLQAVYQALPMFLRGFISLRHLWSRWHLKKHAKPRWFGGEKVFFFCSYFIHLCKESYERGEFYSYQWADLPKLLQREGYNTNWLQHYMDSSDVSSARDALNSATSFNQSREQHGLHTFVYSYITWGVVRRVLRNWLKLTFISFRLRGIQEAFRPRGSHFSLWPLMKDDWLTSLRGPVAISNLLWIELFDAALGDLPHQQTGLYLCENQGWERAFIHAWRKFGHGRLIAVTHTTIRFWDLRYFIDLRTLKSSDDHKIPKPDLTALNGKQAVDYYLSSDFPEEETVECEALRFGHLTNLSTTIKKAKRKDEVIQVLVLGDFFHSTTDKMLRLLGRATRHISAPISYTLKPHPGFQVKAEDYPFLDLKIVTSSLSQILNEFDIVYSANVTTASIDAYYAGLPVIVILDAEDLNFCPLRGVPGVRFASEPRELAMALQEEHHDLDVDTDPEEFFFLDPKLSRWRQLLLPKTVIEN